MKEFFKNIINSFGRGVGRTLSYILVGIVAMLLLTQCAKAATVTDNQSSISENYLEMYKSIYNNSEYDYYIITRSYSNNYSTMYYLCLSNQKPQFDGLNGSTECDKLYSFNNNDNTITTTDNETLTIENSIYYTNVTNKNSFETRTSIYLFILCFSVLAIFLFNIFIRIFVNKSGSVIKYEVVAK